MKLKDAKHNESKEWMMRELEHVLKNISKNKSKDPDGINRSIFHIDCIGSDLKQSLLTMFNHLKSEGIIPEFIKKSDNINYPKERVKIFIKK